MGGVEVYLDQNQTRLGSGSKAEAVGTGCSGSPGEPHPCRISLTRGPCNMTSPGKHKGGSPTGNSTGKLQLSHNENPGR